MSYPFVRAFHRYGNLRTAPRAFVVHLAEGGGTVGYLSRDSARGVSVHYVIERSGRVVQMLHETEASGSINPRDIRKTDDPPFTDPTGAVVTYGRSAAVDVLGTYADNPNAAVLSCEVEGFAKDGPNAAQHAALAALVKDIRTRHRLLPLLGHRDFADYKGCPGKKVRWGDIGGHASTPEAQEPAEPMIQYSPRLYDIAAGVDYHEHPGGERRGSFAAPETVTGIGAPYKSVPGKDSELDREWRAVVKGGQTVVYVRAIDCTNGRPVNDELSVALARIAAAKAALG